MFGLFKKKEEIKWEIWYYWLADWWKETFSEDEQQFILNKYDPLGSSSEWLINWDIEFASWTASLLLTALAWWTKTDAPGITDKFMEKAAEVVKNEWVIDKHFYYHSVFTIYSRVPEKYDMVRNALEEQILLSSEAKKSFLGEFPEAPLPTHTGYEEMFNVFVDEWKNKEAIELAKHAKSEWWNWDWDKKIKKLRQNEIWRKK